MKNYWLIKTQNEDIWLYADEIKLDSSLLFFIADNKIIFIINNNLIKNVVPANTYTGEPLGIEHWITKTN